MGKGDRKHFKNYRITTFLCLRIVEKVLVVSFGLQIANVQAALCLFNSSIINPPICPLPSLHWLMAGLHLD